MSTDPAAVPVPEEPTASTTSPEAAAAAPAGTERVTEPGANDSAPAAVTPEAGDGESSPRRKLRLNPTIDPQVVRPIPNLPAGEVPPAVEPAPAAPVASAAPAVSAAAAPAPEPQAAAEAAPVAPPPERRPAPVAIPRGEALDAEVEAELAAALQGGEAIPPVVPVDVGTETEGAPAEPVTVQDLTSGTKLKGKIQSIDAENVFVDFGLPMTGLVPMRQFDPKRPPQVGAAVQVTVDKVDEGEGLILCNLPRGRGRVSGDWSSVVVGQSVECLVSGTNKGGLEVTVGSLRGFLPASQADLGFVANLDGFVGQRITVRVTEVNPARRRLIVSRRAVLAEEREVTSTHMLEEIHPGQIRTGVVKSIKDFGAFVDLGGIDGFLHVGQISWQRISKPSDVLSEGQSVEVKVLSVDKEKKRVSLSLRQLAQNPWGEAETKYAKGTQVTGRVSRIEPFGAFIELEPGLEGLVHISELDHKRVRAVEEVLTQNQMVELQVLEVDPRRKRISLSAKALKAKPEAVAEAAAAAARPEPVERKNKGPLKGGIGGNKSGGLFGDPRQFG